MDPGQVLAPAGDRPAEPELERQQELLQQAAALVEDRGGAGHHHSHPRALGLASLGLPVDADLGVERGSLRGVLVYDRVAAVAVVADRRLADQHLGARVGGRDRLHEVVRRLDAAVADAALGLLGPALVDLLPDHVDHAVDALQRLGRRTLEGRIPRVPGDRRVGLLRPLRVARQPDDLVAAREQRIADRRTDHPARACDQDPHSTVAKLPVSSETRAIPAWRASSTTAFATAGATSRSNTLGMM